MNIFLNYDTGVIPAALIAINQELSITQEQIAYLGSIVYLGLCCSTLFASYIFRLIPAKWLIIVMVMVSLHTNLLPYSLIQQLVINLQ